MWLRQLWVKKKFGIPLQEQAAACSCNACSKNLANIYAANIYFRLAMPDHHLLKKCYVLDSSRHNFPLTDGG